MLTLLNKYTRETPRHRLSLGKFTQYLKNNNKHVDQLVDSYIKMVVEPIPTSGIDLLNGLLIRADLRYLLSKDDDFDRFRAIDKEYDQMYSSYLRQYPIKQKTFFKGRGFKTAEVVLFTDQFDMAEVIPFGSDNWDDWARLRPVKVLFCNSFELSMDNRSSTVKYSTLPPSEVVISINIPLLLNMYTKYRLMNLESDEFQDQTNNYPFIYKTCIAPLLKDLSGTWVLNIIDTILDGKLEDPKFTFDTDLLITRDRSHFAASGISHSFKEVENMIDSYMKGKMEASTLIDSLKIFHDESLTETIYKVKDDHFIPDGGQNTWLSFMKDYQYVRIIRNIYALRPTSHSSKQFFRYIEIIGKRYGNTRFWDHAKDPFVKAALKERFNSIFGK